MTTPLAIAPIALAGTGFASAPSSARRFTLHYLDDTALLFDAAARQLHALNATSAYIWSCLEQSVPAAAAARTLRETFGFPAEAAEAQVRDVLAARRQLSLVSTARAEQAPARMPGSGDDGAAPDRGPVVQHCYRLLDTIFRLRCSSAAPAYDLVRAFRLLRVERWRPASRTPVALDLGVRNGRFVLRVDNAFADTCRRADQVLPMVKARMVDTALRRSGGLFAVQAAAVSRGRSCLLLAGPSDSGRNVLAAALAADGYRLLGDETAVLTRATLEVRPMALPIRIADDAWRALAGRYPELGILGTHAHGDDRLARYVLPPTREMAQKRRVTSLVFPRRTTSAAAELIPLPRPEALARLVQGLGPPGEALDRNLVERFVRWIENVRCFELCYADLEHGIARLATLGG